MDINEKEKSMLKEWSRNNHGRDSYYETADTEKDSYFIKTEKHVYIQEYSFDTLPELRSMLERMWDNQEEMKEILLPVLVAAMKNKGEDIVPVHTTDDSIETGEPLLAPFIYEF